MSNTEDLHSRVKRCQARMQRGVLSAEMRQFYRAQRALARSHRQRHPRKDERVLRALIDALARRAGIGPGTGPVNGPGTGAAPARRDGVGHRAALRLAGPLAPATLPA